MPGAYDLIAEIPSETQHFPVKVPGIWRYEVGFHSVLVVYDSVLGLACVWNVGIGFLSIVQPEGNTQAKHLCAKSTPMSEVQRNPTPLCAYGTWDW